jgi:hypothetical protein
MAHQTSVNEPNHVHYVGASITLGTTLMQARAINCRQAKVRMLSRAPREHLDQKTDPILAEEGFSSELDLLKEDHPCIIRVHF